MDEISKDWKKSARNFQSLEIIESNAVNALYIN